VSKDLDDSMDLDETGDCSVPRDLDHSVVVELSNRITVLEATQRAQLHWEEEWGSKVTKLVSTLQTLEQAVNTLPPSLDVQAQRLAIIDSSLKDAVSRVKIVEDRCAKLESKVMSALDRCANVDKAAKGNQNGLAGLGDRVALLEGASSSGGKAPVAPPASLTAIEKELQRVKSKLGEWEGKGGLNELAKKVAALDGKNGTDLSKKVAVLEGKVGNMILDTRRTNDITTSRLAALESNQVHVDTLSTTVNTFAGKIAAAETKASKIGKLENNLNTVINRFKGVDGPTFNKLTQRVNSVITVWRVRALRSEHSPSRSTRSSLKSRRWIRARMRRRSRSLRPRCAILRLQWSSCMPNTRSQGAIRMSSLAICVRVVSRRCSLLMLILAVDGVTELVRQLGDRITDGLDSKEEDEKRELESVKELRTEKKEIPKTEQDGDEAKDGIGERGNEEKDGVEERVDKREHYPHVPVGFNGLQEMEASRDAFHDTED